MNMNYTLNLFKILTLITLSYLNLIVFPLKNYKMDEIKYTESI